MDENLKVEIENKEIKELKYGKFIVFLNLFLILLNSFVPFLYIKSNFLDILSGITVPIITLFLGFVLFITLILGIFYAYNFFILKNKFWGYLSLLPIFLILLFFFLSFVYTKINDKYNPNSQVNINKTLIENKYKELQELFNKDILITGISADYLNLDSQNLGYSVYVTPIISMNDKENFFDSDYFNSDERGLHLKFRYRPDLMEYLLNKKVKIVLPDKEYYSKNYCCFEEEENTVVIRAFVYVDNKLFDFHDYPVEDY